jgi:hypothetical protein
MKANVGDWIVVEGPTTGHGRREGIIVSLHHPDGEPPYEVKWADTGKTTLVFPGPDMHLRHPQDQSRSNA